MYRVCPLTAFLTEVIHSFVGRYVYNFQPLLTRAEVMYTHVHMHMHAHTHTHTHTHTHAHVHTHTHAKVYKTGVTHYFSMEKARKDFDYQPEPKTLTGVVKWFRERGHGRPLSRSSQKKSRVWSVLINVVLILLIVMLVASFLPVTE